METVVSREKCLISLPSGRVRGHEAVIFICSATSSSPPHQPGLVQSNAGAVICGCDSKMQYVGTTLYSCPLTTKHLFISNE